MNEHSSEDIDSRIHRLNRVVAIALAWRPSQTVPLSDKEIECLNSILKGDSPICPHCEGTGEVGPRSRESLCPSCAGLGYYSAEGEG